MTSGKRAKAQRKLANPRVSSADLRTRSEAKGIADAQLAQHQAAPTDHPLGEHAGAFVMWQERFKLQLLRVIAENREALLACTGRADCEQSVHQPGCDAVR